MSKNKTADLNTIHDFISFAAEEFEKENLYFGHGTDNPWDEAVYLVLQVLNLPLDSDHAVLNKEVSSADKDTLLKLIELRAKEQIPVPYLTKEAWFAGFPFYVDERVLIPRSPIAELIENRFEPWIDHEKVSRILDIGTGSGCIAIGCAYAFPNANIDAVDIFDDALEVAAINCDRHKEGMSSSESYLSSSGLTRGSADSEKQRIDPRVKPEDDKKNNIENDKKNGSRIRLIKSDLFEKLDNQIYDIIISNPPYVANEERKDLPKEYQHEPEAALFAGNEGDEIVARILKDASKHLSPQGILIVEVGNSAPVIAEKYPNLPFVWLEFEHGESEVFLLTREQLVEFAED